MKGFQCKCGNRQGSNTGEGFKECEGCTKCNTTFSHYLDGHKPLKPHTFINKYNVNTGKPFKECSICNFIDMESYKLSNIKD